MRIFTKTLFKLLIIVFLIGFVEESFGQSTISTNKSSLNYIACTGRTSGYYVVAVTGNNLNQDITVNAPSGIELSVDQINYSTSLILTQSNGTVNKNLYIETIASAPAGTLSGNVGLISGGVTNNIAITGTIRQSPSISLGTINSVNGNSTSFSIPYTITGPGNSYDIYPGTANPLPGFNQILSQNLTPGQITVPIPASLAGNYNFIIDVYNSNTGCLSQKTPFTLQITPPPPTIISSSNSIDASACSGANNNYYAVNITGSYLTNDITATAPSGIELSLDGISFSNTVVFTETSGSVNASLKLRASSTAPVGALSGNITLTSNGATAIHVNITGAVNQLPSFALPLGSVYRINSTFPNVNIPINVTGTANLFDVKPGTPNPLPGFTALSNQNLTSDGINIPIPPTGVGSYNFLLDISGVCSSSQIPVTVQIDPLPSLTSDVNSLVLSGCAGNFYPYPSITIDGTNFTKDLKITPPADYLISSNDGSTFYPFITLTPANGNIHQKLLLTPSDNVSAGPVSGTISFDTKELHLKSISLSGIITGSPKLLINQISDISSSSTSFDIPISIGGNADSYELFGGTKPTPNFTNIVKALTGNTINVPISPAPPGTYDFSLVIYQSASPGCTSELLNFTVTVLPPTIKSDLPSIDLNGCSSGTGTAKQFTITGSYLSNDITVSASPNIQISKDGNAYSSTLTLTQNAGVVNQSLFVINKSTTVGVISENIKLSTNGGTDLIIPITGTVQPIPAVTIGNIGSVTPVSTSFNIPYNLTGTADKFLLSSNGPNLMPNFTTINNVINGNPLSINIPSTSPGTYNFLIQVYKTGGCSSSSVPLSLVVNSNNADLSKFDIQTGNTKTSYSSPSAAYDLNVSNGVSTTAITPYSVDANATILVNNIQVNSGSASPNIPLTVGVNVIKIIVTAADGVTSKTTTINMTRGFGNTTISSFSPHNGGPGTTITIIGQNFNGASKVLFGGVPAAAFQVITDSRIDALVGHTTSGNVEVDVPSSGVGIQSGFVYTVPLPVSFVYLKSTLLNSKVELKWEVEDPLDNKLYTIERSANGKDFIEVGAINGGAENTYSWKDDQPLMVISYYRIKAASKASGYNVYSSAIKVVVGKDNGNISIYPNPVYGRSFNIIFSSKVSGNYFLSILNTIGETVYKKTIEHSGTEISYEIDPGKKLPVGIYSIHIIGPNDVSQTKQLIVSNK